MKETKKEGELVNPHTRGGEFSLSACQTIPRRFKCRLQCVSQACSPANAGVRQGRVQRLRQENYTEFVSTEIVSDEGWNAIAFQPITALLYQSEMSESRVEEIDFGDTAFWYYLKRSIL